MAEPVIRVDNLVFEYPGKRALEKRTRLIVETLVIKEMRQVVQGTCCIGMFWSEHLPTDRKGPFQKRARLGIEPLVIEETSQVIEARCC